jgi:hypothetical protein
MAFSANAALCEHQSTVHFVAAEYVGGIVEFMGLGFLKEYHPEIYKAGQNTHHTYVKSTRKHRIEWTYCGQCHE